MKSTKSFTILIFLLAIGMLPHACNQEKSETKKPNIILVMSDDQGYGQVGYYNHPILKTPNLNNMAESGLRLDRFYAGAPVCSPTRAAVLTGRSNNRSAVYSHGKPMRLQEKTIAQALQSMGYKTAHFGKWHLNGLRGPGVPVLKSDPRNPGAFGFDEWISVTNFFDLNPIMSHKGEFEEFKGSSSDVIVKQALKYISEVKDDNFFVVIWYGSPHHPWSALAEDKALLPDKPVDLNRDYLGEIVEMDRSVGLLRSELKKMGLSQNTLVWFNSDNGGLPEGGKEGVGGLRGFKGSVYEGGLRVPCVIEWPGVIEGGKISSYPSSVMDIFPTIAEILDMPEDVFVKPIDGKSILPLFSNNNLKERDEPIAFKFLTKGALVDNNYKLVVENITQKKYALYNLDNDFDETTDILEKESVKGKEMIEYFENWMKSINNSIEGKDYPEGLLMPDPESKFWRDTPEYQVYFDQWKDRPEYKGQIMQATRK